MLTAEPRLIAGTLFFRLSGGTGPTRTEPVGIAVVTLRRELDKQLVERVRHQQAARDTEKAIRQAIGAGKDAAQHRQALARLDDTAEVLSAEIDHVIGVIEDVRQQAIAHHAKPINDAVLADITASVAHFEIPEHLT